ncbi:helix-turn-helix domain-containing protein [Parabacteroides sp. Marseille-P3160]|uniref:helix-turn-helix domain-containing protein n=1 Tax=Parabacteroides sp. Marseille-P3160 TaxID=1917887 RepID=UPI0009BA93BA|nr:helix-turn-helix domain-containing protein [Parabacteroides sp. Marseille-P3160]
MKNKNIEILIPIEEWYELKALAKETRDMVSGLVEEKKKEVLSPKEVCAMLRIGRSTYQRYVQKGVIKENHPAGNGGKAYILKSEIENLIMEGEL